VIVEAHGIEVFGRHGVNESERREGQTFFVDVVLDLPEPAEDAVTATVDYRRVRDIVHDVNAAATFQLLETFAAAVADSIREQLPVARVQGRVRKPGIAWAEWTAVTVERS